MKTTIWQGVEIQWNKRYHTDKVVKFPLNGCCFRKEISTYHSSCYRIESRTTCSTKNSDELQACTEKGLCGCTSNSILSFLQQTLNKFILLVILTEGVSDPLAKYYKNGLTTGMFLQLLVTWDQTQFLFRFVNNIPAGKGKRKESLIQTFYEMSAAYCFDWLTFAESANQTCFCFLFF